MHLLWVWQTWMRSMFLPGVSCARRASAPAPASRSRKQGGMVTRTSRNGLEWAVGSLVACNGAGHVLTCHSTSDSLVLVGNNIVLSIASISEAAGETATAHASTFGTRGAVNSSFARLVDTRTSGSLSRGFVSEGLDHSDRWTDCDAVTRVSNASHHLAIVASVRCSTQSFRNRAHRWGLAVSFPLPSGEHRTVTLRTLTCCRKEQNLVHHAWNGWRCFAGSAALRARSGACVLLLADRGAS